MNGPTGTTIGSGVGMGVGAAVGGPMGAMAGGAIGGLAGSLFDSGSSPEALAALKRAQAAIAAIPVPTAKDMQLILAPLVQQGVLTPQSYSTILQQPSEFLNINIDQTGRNAELAGLNQLQDIAQSGGMDAEYRNTMNDAQNQANTGLEGQRESILQNAASRGALNSNITTADQLSQAQSGAYNANQFSSAAAAAAEQRALSAITESANLGGQITAQDYSQASQKAAAMDAISRYNAQNTQQQSNMNVQGQNEAQAQNLDMAQQIAQYNNQLKNQSAQWNAQLPQQIFQDQLSKQAAATGVSTNLSNSLQGGYQAGATTQGNLIGGLGQNLSNYYNNQNLTNALSKLGSATPAATTGTTAPVALQSSASSTGGWMSRGGRVPGRAPVPGDSPANDVVPAHLSPGEVVVPRSSAGSPAALAQFMAHMPQGPSKIHPEDVKTVLQALSAHRGG
jgi:hypothetical protein